LPEIDLRIFYRDKKEIARIAFWGEAKAQLLSGELPAGKYRRTDEEGKVQEELELRGNGEWDYRGYYPTAPSSALLR
jgi:hypothetical protein